MPISFARTILTAKRQYLLRLVRNPEMVGLNPEEVPTPFLAVLLEFEFTCDSCDQYHPMGLVIQMHGLPATLFNERLLMAFTSAECDTLGDVMDPSVNGYVVDGDTVQAAAGALANVVGSRLRQTFSSSFTPTTGPALA